MQTSTAEQIRETVRQAYGAIAAAEQGSADLGLGCGNPQAVHPGQASAPIVASALIEAVKPRAPEPVPPACCNSMRIEACCQSPG